MHLGSTSLQAGTIRRTISWARVHGLATGGIYALLSIVTMVSVVVAAGGSALRFAVPALAFLPLLLGVFPGEQALVDRYERARD